MNRLILVEQISDKGSKDIVENILAALSDNALFHAEVLKDVVSLFNANNEETSKMST